MLRVEERTVELLKADEAQRARALAEQIAQEEELIERLRDQLGKIQSREQQLRGRIHLALQAARHSRNELRLARSNEEAMRATAQLQPALGRQLDEMPAEVQSTLQRIRERQQSRQDESDAGSIIYAEFTRDTLASGKSRVGRTDAVLHRLRQLHLSPNA
jgi:phage shock protein A